MKSDSGLRPASVVMSASRAAAVVPNALSFSRTAVRELVKGRWRIEKARFDLDAEGRGEILYRLVGAPTLSPRTSPRTFHFFLVSLKLDEAMKMDRNWAQSWDAMGVLCQGEWTPEREALLRREVPKQRGGWADYGTLVYARGNRSARIFDHVVEALAAGRQPEAALIAPVGYFLRTTAFIANGQLGTTPLAALDGDHPFRRPYHIQMVSAWMLREFVFDLVDHIARARNPRAARLSAQWRRYIGLGNAAATGLVPFVASHPHFMHRWALANESALAAAKARMAPADIPRFGELLSRAIRHFRDTEQRPDGAFAGPGTVARDLERVLAALGTGSVPDWPALGLVPESVEVLNAIAIELHPGAVEAEADNFHADERFEVRPAMTQAALAELVRADYGWALDDAFADAHYFWYRAAPAPRDLRRGIRGLAPEFEHETPMDVARKVRELHAVLEAGDGARSVAELLAARPDLRHVVARVQSLAGMAYAELRVNWLAKDLSPFAPVRFPLAFKGMDKLESALPKSVRGALMQGAPIAEDVEDGADGTWPYPPQPSGAGGRPPRQPLPPPDHDARTPGDKARDTPGDPRRLWTVAPGDLWRTAHAALQGRGAPLGVAQEAASILLFAQGCGVAAVPALLRHCGARDSALLAAPAALDLACARALASPGAAAIEVVRGVKEPGLLGQLALRCAQRGLAGVVLWRDGGAGYAISAPGTRGPWFVSGEGDAQAWLSARGFGAAPGLEEGSFALLCRATQPTPYAPISGARIAWSEAELARCMRAWQVEGLTLPRAELAALYEAGGAIWVPAAEEPRLRPGESVDALKNF